MTHTICGNLQLNLHPALSGLATQPRDCFGGTEIRVDLAGIYRMIYGARRVRTFLKYNNSFSLLLTFRVRAFFFF